MTDRPIAPVAQPDFEAPARKVIAQKRFSNATRFALGKDDFEYELRTEGSVRTYRLEYSELTSERESLVDRNPWWRNVGLIWMVLGALMAVAKFVDTQTVTLPVWLWLGAICYGVYHFRVIRFHIIPAERCSVLIIDNASGQEILRELESRRAAQLRARYDFISRSEHPDQQRSRFHWLGKQGVLDANELSARMLQLDAISSAYDQARDDRDDD